MWYTAKRNGNPVNWQEFQSIKLGEAFILSNPEYKLFNNNSPEFFECVDGEILRHFYDDKREWITEIKL